MKAFISVTIMAVITYLTRVLPITIFRKKIKSKFIKSFLYYIPYAVLGAMTFPSILHSTGHIFSALIGLFVALILSYFERGLMTVASISILVVYFIEKM